MPHVTRYSVMPIPAVAEHEESFEAGAVRVGVEYRLLTDAIAAADHLEGAGGDTLGLTTGLDDRGVSLHVYSEQDGEERELLRFDCFQEDPHYHYVSWRDKTNAMVVYLASFVRVPVLQLQSFLRGAPRASFIGATFTDPLLTGHKRFWLLVVNLLLAGALAFLAARRLRRLGAPPVRGLCWGALICAGGVLPFLLYRLAETDRAWRKAKILTPTEIPPMWIRSAS